MTEDEWRFEIDSLRTMLAIQNQNIAEMMKKVDEMVELCAQSRETLAEIKATYAQDQD
jgi:hypothetical protein